MKRYRVIFELGTYVCEVKATDEDDAYDKAKEYAINEMGYDMMKHAEGEIEEVTE